MNRLALVALLVGTLFAALGTLLLRNFVYFCEWPTSIGCPRTGLSNPTLADLFTAFGLMLIVYSLLTSRRHLPKPTRPRTGSLGTEEEAA